jgi:hypothetical protein
MIYSGSDSGSGSGKNFGSGSGKKFRVRPDPDPQHLLSGRMEDRFLSLARIPGMLKTRGATSSSMEEAGGKQIYQDKNTIVEITVHTKPKRVSRSFFFIYICNGSPILACAVHLYMALD